MQFLRHRKDPLVTTVCLSVCSLDLTKVVSSSESNKRCGLKDAVASRRGWKDFNLCMIVDIERRAGLYVITRGTLGWLVVIWLGLSVSLRRCDCMNSLDFFSFSLLRYWMSSLARKVKHSSEEHMRRNRRARLDGMARLVRRGWHDNRRRYWCLYVGLV